MREKWDAEHFADGSTYGEKTISRAVQRVTDHYDPAEPSISSDATSAKRLSQTVGETEERERTVGTYHDDERLRAIIERLDERIDALEVENDRLRTQLERESSSAESSVQAPQSTDRESLWSRAKRLLGIS